MVDELRETIQCPQVRTMLSHCACGAVRRWVCTCTHTRMHTHAQAHAHMDTHIHTHTYVGTYTHAHSRYSSCVQYRLQVSMSWILNP